MAQTRKRRIQRSLDPAGYLGMPYSRVVIPEQDGTFRAEIFEFPGCIATGDTEVEALASLKDVALSWLEATIAKGQVIPEPLENMEYSGKLVLRLPKSLHKKAARAAERDGSSLNQFIVSSLAEHIGTVSVVSPAAPMTYAFIQHSALSSSIIESFVGESQGHTLTGKIVMATQGDYAEIPSKGDYFEFPTMLKLERNHARD